MTGPRPSPPGSYSTAGNGRKQDSVRTSTAQMTAARAGAGRGALVGGREDLRVLGGAASPTASGSTCKQESSGKKRRAGRRAAGQGPGRPACRGSGPAPLRLGEGSETQQLISKAAWYSGLARPGPPSPYSGCLPSPPRSVQCLESAGDRDAPGKGDESCIGAT